MKEIDATRIKLKCLEMVEGTGLEWWKVIRMPICISDRMPDFSANKEDYELALGIVEGKPVWEGDELYYAGIKFSAHYGHSFTQPGWSWTPPKQKTLMVELPLEDVELYADERELSLSEIMDLIGRCAEACRKALEKPIRAGSTTGCDISGVTSK